MDLDQLISQSKDFVDDLDKYRNIWESSTHWYARKSFLRHNWNDLEDKNRLICLSEAWYNMNFMGNRSNFIFLIFFCTNNFIIINYLIILFNNKFN